MSHIPRTPSQTAGRRPTDLDARTDVPAAAQPTPTPGGAARAAYTPARLERLGPWRALTLQQSIPIGPGFGMLIPRIPKPERLA